VSKQLSIAEARGKLDNLVLDAERGETVELTHGGERVAVLLSWDEYERLAGPQPPLPPQPPQRSFIERLEEWRKTVDWEEMGDPAEIWANVRDQGPGRDPKL
jgi:prevent-host-death family protein